MKIHKKKDESLEETHVLVSYPDENEEVRQLLSLLCSVDTQVHCKKETQEYTVNASDIFYIESVEKKTFVYLEKDVLRTDLRLYQLREMLLLAGFVQISKSCLLNIRVLENIQPLMNSRMEANLSNGEKVLVTRKYLVDIKRALREVEIR